MIATIIVALITALAAVLAPSITEIFRSRNELALKQLEITYPLKQQAFHEFLAAYSNWMVERTDLSWSHVLISAHDAMLYADRKTFNSISLLLDVSPEERDAEFRETLELVNKELHISPPEPLRILLRNKERTTMASSR